MIVLDTNVLSETLRRKPADSVRQSLRERGYDLMANVVEQHLDISRLWALAGMT